MKNEVMQHVEEALNQFRALFMKAAERIEALNPGEKVPATQLAKDLAKEHGMTGAQLYPILRIFIENYPGCEVRRGAHGGILRLPLAEPKTDGNDGSTKQ